jgi:integrase
MGHIKKSANVVQTDSAGLAKTSQAYWLKRVKIPAGRVHYGIQIAHRGERQFFNLETPEKTNAAGKAQRIYLDIIGKGWEAAIAIHRPMAVKAKKSATVGALIEAAASHSKVRPGTFETYAKALRRLALGVIGEKEPKKQTAASIAERRALADSIRLDKLTPDAVNAFKVQFLKEVEGVGKRKSAAVTINSILRNSAALMKKRDNLRKIVAAEIELPAELWFDGIQKEKEPSLRYRSKIDAGSILAAAQTELKPEPFKALMLTLVLGLRRSEADTLQWWQFDFEEGTLDVCDTEDKQLKSEDSAGVLALDAELKALFQGFYANRKGEGVLETPKGARVTTRKARGYRCEPTFKALIAWLRSKGVSSGKPIHTLRKEIGSIIATREGIFAASRYLRHSSIQITSQIYADLKKPISAGLGAFLRPAADNVIEADFKAAQGVMNGEGRVAL